jgi:hypothetical protein
MRCPTSCKVATPLETSASGKRLRTPHVIASDVVNVLRLDLWLSEALLALGTLNVNGAMTAGLRKMYFRSLLDPTPVMLQRFAMSAVLALRQLMMDRSTSRGLGAASPLNRLAMVRTPIYQHTTSILHASHHGRSFGRSKRHRCNRHVR